jgi:hypothetical protein
MYHLKERIILIILEMKRIKINARKFAKKDLLLLE